MCGLLPLVNPFHPEATLQKCSLLSRRPLTFDLIDRDRTIGSRKSEIKMQDQARL